MPLHEAAMKGNLECVKLLLEEHAPLLPRTTSGEFPLDLAKEHNQTEVVEYLENYKPPEPSTKQSEWYHGSLDRNEAISLLQNFSSKMHVESDEEANSSTDDSKKSNELKTGFFLVRYSKGDHVLTLICDNSFKNFKIQQHVCI